MPKVVDHEEKRREIGEAVWRAVARRGMDSATVREIADEAGVSTGVLAHYFEDKDELLVHALRVSVERAAGRIKQRSFGRGNLEALRTVLREGLPLDEQSRNEYRVWLSFWGRAANSEALAAEQNHWYALWRGVVMALIEECQREGILRADLEAGREASALIALVDGIGLQAIFEPERLPKEEQEAALDAHIARLKSPGGSSR